MSDAVQHLVQRMILARPAEKKKTAKYKNLAAIQSAVMKRTGMYVDKVALFQSLDAIALEADGRIDTREMMALLQAQANLQIRSEEKILPSLKPVDSQAADKSQKLQLTWKK